MQELTKPNRMSIARFKTVDYSTLFELADTWARQNPNCAVPIILNAGEQWGKFNVTVRSTADGLLHPASETSINKLFRIVPVFDLAGRYTKLAITVNGRVREMVDVEEVSR